MKPLFSTSGLRVLEALSLADTLYAFDFDGTLAPIITDPQGAQAGEGVWSLIEALVQFAPVAIVSGRAVADLEHRVPVRGIRLVGNHGMEGLKGKSASEARTREAVSSWCTQLTQAKEGVSAFSDPGVFLEDKGLSLALHYRNSRQRKVARQKLLAQVALLQPTPRVILGKSVVNLLPSGAPHKGVALLEVLAECRRGNALYVGDDDTDEDVFSLRDPRVLSVRVGYKRASQAQFYLQRQSEIKKLLKRILAELSETQEVLHAGERQVTN